MTPQTENDHPARLLFDFVLREFRSVVQTEVATLRADMQQLVQAKSLAPQTKPFYSLKEAAAELNLSQATVRRLIARGLLRSSKATRHIRIPRQQIDEFARSTI
jgi:excisionase family DNA binding protein